MPKQNKNQKPAPNPEQALYQALSLCRKAGQLTMGFDAVEEACVKGKAWLVLTASDASPKTVQRMKNAVGDLVDVLPMPLTQDQLAAVCHRAVAVYAVLLLLAQFLPGLLRVDRSEYGTYRVMFIFSNIGFMGFPVISAVYGSQALLRASLFLIVFNCLVYTYGIQMISGNPEKKAGFQWKKIANMGVIACVLSLVLYLLAVPVPDFMESAVDYLGGLTTPLSMIIIGDSLAQIPLKSLFADKKLLLFSLLKLIVVPVAGTFAVLSMGVSGEVAGICMIIFAAPVASMTVMLAQEYNGKLELATKGVALTTLLSVATIPLVSLITGV